ncbi:MAG: hypothetical protein ACPH77_15130 [Pseudomonadales bacterium]
MHSLIAYFGARFETGLRFNVADQFGYYIPHVECFMETQPI